MRFIPSGILKLHKKQTKMPVQCCIEIFNPKSGKFRPCRGYGRLLGYNDFCFQHKKHYYAETILTCWRSFYIQKKIAVFKHLPIDIWNKILSFSKPAFDKKFLLTTLKIYEQRRQKFNNLYEQIPSFYLSEELRIEYFKFFHYLKLKTNQVTKYLEYHY